MPGERNTSTDVLPVVSPRISPKKGNVKAVADQLTDHQRQFGVEIFRGIDIDYSGQLSADELSAVIESGAEMKAANLEVGLQQAIQRVVDTIDPGKYKQGFGKFKDKDGLWINADLQVNLHDDMADGALDLPEWLRFLRKVKIEKVHFLKATFDFMTDTDAIRSSDAGMDYWFEQMAGRINENKVKRREAFAERERAIKEAQRTPQPSPRLTPAMMAGPNMLTDAQKKMATKMFKKIDFNKSMQLDEKEILVLFEEEEGKKLMEELDGDGSKTVGIEEWLVFLRNHKRHIFTKAIAEDPANEAGAIQAADDELAELFKKMAVGLESDASKKLRTEIKRRDIEMNEDAKMLDNPLGGYSGLKSSDAVRAARAEQFSQSRKITDTRFTPAKKLVYRPHAQKEYSERDSDFYGSVGNWTHSSVKTIADSIGEDAEAKWLQNKSAADRSLYREAAHAVYNETTAMLNERVKDSLNAKQKIEKAMQGTEGYVRCLEEARDAVATMFDLDAEALEEVKFCKEKRATRPVTERIKDQVSLALKRRTEELDIESHEDMLSRIDDTQKALWKAGEFLKRQLGDKAEAASFDKEAAEMIPGIDPAEIVEKTIEDGNVEGEGNVWVKPKQIPKSKKLQFAMFQKYAKAYPLRGTTLPKAPTFADILENNSYIDQTEFARFVHDYGFSQMLDQSQIAEIFQRNARKEDAQAGSLHFEEFMRVVKEVHQEHKDMKKDWGNDVPPPLPFLPARKTALTMQAVLFESHIKDQLPKKPHLHDKVYIPVHQPVMWKKEVRDLCDSVKGHQAEAERIFRKSKKFVEKRRLDDELGRKRLRSALAKKMDDTERLIGKLSKQKQQAVDDHAKDMEEKELVEGRIAAVEDYLGVAVGRLQHRMSRPSKERGRDPAEWALDEEVRELRWELHQLGQTHKKLDVNLDKLEKLILQLNQDIADKETSRNLDAECYEKLGRRLLEPGENAAVEAPPTEGELVEEIVEEEAFDA